MPWGVKSVTSSSRYNAERDNLLPSASSFGRPLWCGHYVNSMKRAQKLTAPPATTSWVSHDQLFSSSVHQRTVFSNLELKIWHALHYSLLEGFITASLIMFFFS